MLRAMEDERSFDSSIIHSVDSSWQTVEETAIAAYQAAESLRKVCSAGAAGITGGHTGITAAAASARALRALAEATELALLQAKLEDESSATSARTAQQEYEDALRARPKASTSAAHRAKKPASKHAEHATRATYRPRAAGGGAGGPPRPRPSSAPQRRALPPSRPTSAPAPKKSTPRTGPSKPKPNPAPGQFADKFGFVASVLQTHIDHEAAASPGLGVGSRRPASAPRVRAQPDRSETSVSAARTSYAFTNRSASAPRHASKGPEFTGHTIASRAKLDPASARPAAAPAPAPARRPASPALVLTIPTKHQAPEAPTRRPLSARTRPAPGAQPALARRSLAGGRVLTARVGGGYRAVEQAGPGPRPPSALSSAGRKKRAAAAAAATRKPKPKLHAPTPSSQPPLVDASPEPAPDNVMAEPMTGWDQLAGAPVEMHYAIMPERKTPVREVQTPKLRTPPAVKALAQPKFVPCKVFVRRWVPGNPAGLSKEPAPIILPRRVDAEAPTKASEVVSKGKREYMEQLLLPVLKQVQGALQSALPIKALYSAEGHRRTCLEDFRNNEVVWAVAAGEHFTPAKKLRGSGAARTPASARRGAGAGARPSPAGAGESPSSGGEESPEGARSVTVTVFPSGQDKADGRPGTAVVLPAHCRTLQEIHERVEDALGGRAGGPPVKSLYTVPDSRLMDSPAMLHHGLELSVSHSPAPASPGAGAPRSGGRSGGSAAAKRLSAPRHEAPSIVYHVHRVQHPAQSPPQHAAHAVRLPWPAGLSMSVDEVCRRITRSLKLPPAMAVEALFNTSTYARITNTSNMTPGEHILYACKGDRHPRVRRAPASPSLSVESAPDWLKGVVYTDLRHQQGGGRSEHRTSAFADTPSDGAGPAIASRLDANASMDAGEPSSDGKGVVVPSSHRVMVSSSPRVMAKSAPSVVLSAAGIRSSPARGPGPGPQSPSPASSPHARPAAQSSPEADQPSPADTIDSTY